MKTLDLYSPASSVIGRMATDIKQGMTDKEFLEHEIKSWLKSPERLKQLEGEAYYDGIQDILNRKRTVIGENGDLEEVKNLPNNKIIDNQYAKMVDQKSNYLCGKPITFNVENKLFEKALSKFFNKRMQRSFRIAAEKALTGGKVWMFPYYNSANELVFAMFPAHEILPFWSDAEHTDLDCAAHLYPVYVYNEKGDEEIVFKAEILHGAGIERFIWKDGCTLIPDTDASSGSYITVKDNATGETIPYNWQKMPLVCFKSNHREIPLICRVKCLQDALNLLYSDFANSMEEDVRNTILVIHNYDGEDLGSFRHNLATYGAVKVRSFEGTDGGVDTLEVEVNAENYKIVIDLLKKAIIENAKGYDVKDERMSNNPNQMNIRSMYLDIDLDANGMETEFQAAFEELLWFIKVHLKNTGQGDFMNEDATPIFNRDTLVNEGEVIENCGKSKGIISDETIMKQHPWIDDPSKELKRIEVEKQKSLEEADAYREAFVNGSKNSDTPPGDGVIDE